MSKRVLPKTKVECFGAKGEKSCGKVTESKFVCVRVGYLLNACQKLIKSPREKKKSRYSKVNRSHFYTFNIICVCCNRANRTL